MRARVLVEAGDAIPAVLEIEPDQSVRIGRHRDNTVVLRDEHASRWHAEICFDQGRWLIRNVGNPLNGTSDNKAQIAGNAALADGQEIGIGETRLRFFQEGAEPDNTATPPQPAMAEQGGTVPEAPQVGEASLGADVLTVLCRFMAESAADAEPQVLIRRALQTVLSHTGAAVAGFLSLDPDNPLPKLVLPELAHVDFHLSRRLTQKVQAEGRPVRLGNEAIAREPSESLLPFTDAVCVPLLAEGGPLGAIHVYQANLYFSERHVRFCEVLAGYLAKSLHVLRVRRSLEAENSRLRCHSPASEELIGESPAMQQLRQLIARAAPRPSIVLIQGESGVGKEL